MKVVYIQEIERHTAYDRKKFCYKCGAHEWKVVKETDPDGQVEWYVECPQCGARGPVSPLREIAIARWKQL